MGKLPVFDLGNRTVVRIVSLGMGHDVPTRRSAFLPFEYDFVSRGTLSHYQVRKRLSRWLYNSFFRVQTHYQKALKKPQQIRLQRNEAWERKNIRCLQTCTNE